MSEVQLALTIASTAVASLVALLSWLVRAVTSGVLVPRAQHEARMADKDQQITTLTTRVDNITVAAQVSARQVESLSTIGEQTVTIMNEIRELARQARQDRTRRTE